MRTKTYDQILAAFGEERARLHAAMRTYLNHLEGAAKESAERRRVIGAASILMTDEALIEARMRGLSDLREVQS